MVLICLTVSLVWAVTDRADTDGNALVFSASTLLKVIEGSPTIPTDWIFAIDKAKEVDLTIKIPIVRIRYDFEDVGSAGSEYFTINVIDKLWDLLIDSVMGVTYAGTVLVQGLTYALYFLRYLFV